MKEILEQINKAIDEYHDVKLDFNSTNTLSEILRTLTSNLFYLEKYRSQYHDEWLDHYNMTTGTNAHKERTADDKIRELYMLRRLMTSAYKIVDALRSQISVYKKEG